MRLTIFIIQPTVPTHRAVFMFDCLFNLFILFYFTSPSQNKVTSITFLCGKALEDLCRIKQVWSDSMFPLTFKEKLVRGGLG